MLQPAMETFCQQGHDDIILCTAAPYRLPALAAWSAGAPGARGTQDHISACRALRTIARRRSQQGGHHRLQQQGVVPGATVLAAAALACSRLPAWVTHPEAVWLQPIAAKPAGLFNSAHCGFGGLLTM